MKVYFNCNAKSNRIYKYLGDKSLEIYTFYKVYKI